MNQEYRHQESHLQVIHGDGQTSDAVTSIEGSSNSILLKPSALFFQQHRF
jgi:hypothetical protein